MWRFIEVSIGYPNIVYEADQWPPHSTESLLLIIRP